MKIYFSMKYESLQNINLNKKNWVFLRTLEGKNKLITLKSQREIEQMERSSKILADIHIGLRELIKPGIDMWEIESL